MLLFFRIVWELESTRSAVCAFFRELGLRSSLNGSVCRAAHRRLVLSSVWEAFSLILGVSWVLESTRVATVWVLTLTVVASSVCVSASSRRTAP
jgi:hypothetical protein